MAPKRHPKSTKINEKATPNPCQNEGRKNDTKMSQNGAKSDPKWSPKCIQKTQRGAKGSQRGAKIAKKTGKGTENTDPEN